MNISNQVAKKKKHRKRQREQKESKDEDSSSKKRVKFDLGQSMTRGNTQSTNSFRVFHIWQSGNLETAREQEAQLTKQGYNKNSNK